MPTKEEQLIALYAAAGYKFPTSIPRIHLTLPPRSSSYLLEPPENMKNTETTATTTPTASLSPSSAQSRAATASSTTPTASSGPSPAQSTAASSGLNPGAKAGIAIGITLSVILCTACVLLLYLRRRRRHRQNHQLQSQQQQQQQQEQRRHKQQHYGSGRPNELASSLRAPTQGYGIELEGTPVGAEMEGNTQRIHEEQT